MKHSATHPQRTRNIYWLENILVFITVGALCGFSLSAAILASHECQWPAEWDTLRDMGMAQTLLDGNYPADPILSDETLWYNPLTGALIATASRILDLPLNLTSIAIGPYVNLLAPLGIAVLLALLFGRAAAIAGVCAVLFAKDPQTSFWVNACYSPWLLAPLYSLGLFFLTLTTCYYATAKRSFIGHLAAGLLLGITFMTHTAPALIIGGVLVLTLCVETPVRWCKNRKVCPCDTPPLKKQDRQLWRLPLYFFILLAAAFITSLPYTWSILRHYHFNVENPFPSLFAADYVTLAQLPDRLREAVNWRNALALAGTVVLLSRCRRSAGARFVLYWLLVVLAFTCQHYVWQALLSRGIVLTAFVPGHHAAIHLSAVRAVLFAVGASTLGAQTLQLLHRPLTWKYGDAGKETLRRTGALSGVLLAGLILYLANPLSTRVDFITPDRALYHEFHEQNIPMYQWILENTAPSAVFLCEEESIGMTVVMPTGRKLAAVMLLYSNPYVPVAPLFEAQEKLFDAIERGDKDTFCQWAKEYPSLYLLV
ncbi:MAG: hypothetical protein KAH38_05635, partial [Candidatus Hydrogenedentes bacterium]|nr:hypothetical protein [Candidatus Hydrogenedentota bacterium]